MRRYLLYIVLLPLLLLTSCNQWLQIDPDDRIMEENLFSSRDGFTVALNGIYIEMSSSTLYGGKMMVDLFDVCAQYYTDDLTSDNGYSYYANFNYTQENVKKTYASIWEKYYNLIVNCNTIIEHCDEGKALLGEKYYNVIKGEALGLRALFHFEVLRIWGPVFKDNKEMKCIPYAENSQIEVRPLLAASTIYEKIKADLLAAESYLQKSDPVITEGPLFSAGGYGEGNDMRYRNLRLNYFAVQALLARVAIYCDDKPLALQYANKVVDEVQKEGSEIFPFITRDKDPQDRVYKSELLFAHYNTQRADVYKNYFSNSLSNSNVLRVSDDMVDEMYDETDYRLKYQWSKQKSPSDVEQYYFIKYKEVPLNSMGTDQVQKEYRYLVPMIRVSEMYYIIAECEQDPVKALKALNKVRNARAIKEITDITQLPDELEKEYKREFIGEGQMFFYYKRIAKDKIQYGTMSWYYVTMSTDKYVPALPDPEKNNRVE